MWSIKERGCTGNDLDHQHQECITVSLGQNKGHEEESTINQLIHTTNTCPRVLSHSVVFDYLQPHGLQPDRLLCPRDFPGKNTGVDCHFLLQGIFPNPGIEPTYPASSALADRFFTTEPHGKSQQILTRCLSNAKNYSKYLMILVIQCNVVVFNDIV